VTPDQCRARPRTPQTFIWARRRRWPAGPPSTRT
jgi:hypothetical protein